MAEEGIDLQGHQRIRLGAKLGVATDPYLRTAEGTIRVFTGFRDDGGVRVNQPQSNSTCARSLSANPCTRSLSGLRSNAAAIACPLAS